MLPAIIKDDCLLNDEGLREPREMGSKTLSDPLESSAEPASVSRALKYDEMLLAAVGRSASGVDSGESPDITEDEWRESDLLVPCSRRRLVPRRTAGRGPPICRFSNPILERPKSVSLR